MSPVLLCVLAVAAAALTAYIGSLMSPSVRTRRAQRRRWADLIAARHRIAGQLACVPGAWITFWYDHELDMLDAASEVADAS